MNWNDKSNTDPNWEGNTETRGFDYVGVHVRRGDRKAEAYPNVGKYVPVLNYAWAAEKTWERVIGGVVDGNENGDEERDIPPTVVWLATDAPDVIEEFTDAMSDPHIKPKSGDAKVLSLSTSSNVQLKEISSKQAYNQSVFNELPIEERVRATRGMVVDLAMISGLWVEGDDDEDAPDNSAVAPLGVVCTLR